MSNNESSVKELDTSAVRSKSPKAVDNSDTDDQDNTNHKSLESTEIISQQNIDNDGSTTTTTQAVNSSAEDDGEQNRIESTPGDLNADNNNVVAGAVDISVSNDCDNDGKGSQLDKELTDIDNSGINDNQIDCKLQNDHDKAPSDNCLSGTVNNEEKGEMDLPQDEKPLEKELSDLGSPSDSTEKSSHCSTAIVSDSSMNHLSSGELPSSSTNETASSAAAMDIDSSEGARVTCSSASSPSSDKAPSQSIYHVKWIKFKEIQVAIITQNENGPCPLLAIMNVLLMKRKIKLPSMIEMVTSGQLMEYLADCIFENAPKDISEAAQLNYEQNMHDAMAVFHKLQTGLDVNVKFTGVNDFEYTSECIVFDLLNLPLYHGWLPDPESPEVVSAIGNCSYNQLVEKIISQKSAKREELLTEALICEEFLERTAAQLTYYGLSELCSTVKDDELCIFFRNNHFSTLYKYKNELFLLVTDQGFLTESNVVWETLSNVEGDGHFVNADFRTYRKPETSTVPILAPSIPAGSEQQVDQDYLVALSLQQEAASASQLDLAGSSWQSPATQYTPLSDHELAIQLQEEENRRAASVQQRQASRQDSSGSANSRSRKKKKVPTATLR